MSPDASTPGPAAGPTRKPARPPWRRAGVTSALLVALGLGLGALGGVVWEGVSDLPTYLVGPDGGATTTERGLADMIGSEAWFAVIGAVVGLVLGTLGWWRLRDVGWPVVLLGTGTAVLAALLCWAVGKELGPGEFTSRLQAARPGDRVPVELTLQARASLLVWPFFAVVPILLGSSLGPDAEDPRPPSRRPPSRRPAGRSPGRRRGSDRDQSSAGDG